MADTVGGSVVYYLDVDKSKLSAGLSDAKKEVDDTSKSVDKSVAGMSEGVTKSSFSISDAFAASTDASQKFALALGAVVTGLAGVATFGLKTAGDLEASRQGFITLLGSASEADAVLKMIKKDAASTPFELPGLIKANQLLTSVTHDGARSEAMLLNVGKALAAMGKGQPELDRVVVNLQQIGAVGHASAIDIKQFAFAGIDIYGLLNAKLKETKASVVDNSKAIGKSSDELNKLQGQLKVAELRQKEFNDKTKESTKLQTQNTIDQYRSKISGLTGKVGDLTAQNGKLATSQTSLDDAIRDGKVTFDLLEEVFAKAGAAGGKYGDAFKNQAGTLNQLWSNLKDSITIAGSELVVQTGIFDIAKMAIQGLMDAIQKFTPEVVGGILTFFQFTLDHLPVIVGLIVGGLTPAIIALGIAIGGAVIAIAPFMIAGAALGILIPQLVEQLGGWNNITTTLSTTFQGLSNLFTMFVLPALRDLWNEISTNLIPALQQWWNLMSPILIPTLKMLGLIISVFVAEVLYILIETITVVIKMFTGLLNITNTVIEIFKQILNFFRAGDWAGLGTYITKPFSDAWNWIKDHAEAIKNTIRDAFDPTQHHSPSLVDRVTAGIDDIKKQYKSLSALSLPTLGSGAPMTSGGTAYSLDSLTGGSSGSSNTPGAGQTNIVNIGTVNNKSDIDMINRELGFKAALIPST